MINDSVSRWVGGRWVSSRWLVNRREGCRGFRREKQVGVVISPVHFGRGLSNTSSNISFIYK